jgi:hypothetical protein
MTNEKKWKYSYSIKIILFFFYCIFSPITITEIKIIYKLEQKIRTKYENGQ